MGDDDGLCRNARRGIVGTKVASQDGCDAEDAQELRRDARGAHDLGAGVPRDRGCRAGRARQRFPYGRLRPPVEEVRFGRGELRPATLRIALENPHEAIGRAVWQRAKHHGIDDGKDRGVDADTEREGDDRDGRERGTPAKAAGGVAQILKPCADAGERRGAPGGSGHAWPAPLGARELVAERIALVELLQDAARGVRGAQAARDERTVAIVEVLRQFLDHRGVPRRVDPASGQALANGCLPVMHCSSP